MTHSFIIPVYGESQYLEDCIKSLMNQTVPSEIILTSATDTDFLKEIAKKYNLKYFINPDGNQIGKDWNFALSKASTDLVTLAHQDDVYLKDYSKKIIEAFNENPDSTIIYTNLKEIHHNKVDKDNLNLRIKHLLSLPQKLYPSKFSQDIALRFGNSICCPAVTYNMNQLKDFKFNEDLKSNLDWLAWADLHHDGHKLRYLPEVLMLHRYHEDSETSKIINDNNRLEEDIVIFNKFWPKPIANLIEIIYKNSEKRSQK